MRNPFLILGYIMFGTAFFLIFWGLIWMSVVGSWICFPFGFIAMVSGICLINLMKDDPLYKKESN